MDVGTFIVAVFCTVEDWLEGEQPLRQRGPKPKLSDSEALTIEIAGEFLGIDTDRGLYAYFRQNYGEWFPALKEIHRTTFCRQAANLWVAKERLWKHLLNRVRFEASLSLVDSFPVEVCRFAPSLPLQALGGGVSIRLRRDGEADLLRFKGSSKSVMARSDLRREPSSREHPRPAHCRKTA